MKLTIRVLRAIIILGWLVYLTILTRQNRELIIQGIKIDEGQNENVKGLIETDSMIIEYLKKEK
jgi:hypothetical protein